MLAKKKVIYSILKTIPQENLSDIRRLRDFKSHHILKIALHNYWHNAEVASSKNNVCHAFLSCTFCIRPLIKGVL